MTENTNKAARKTTTRKQKKNTNSKTQKLETNLHNLLGSAIFLWLLCANQTLAMKVFCSVQITTLLWRFSKCWGAKENTQTVKTWDHSTKLNWKSKKSKKQLKLQKIHERSIENLTRKSWFFQLIFFGEIPKN